MEKRAVLVGINQYSGAPLAGCINDIQRAKLMLLNEYGYNPNNIKMLLDGQATTKNYLDALHWMSSNSKTGDIALHYYSGHGAQVPDNKEADHLDEVVCPFDFDWSPSKMITDKQFFNIFKTIQPGVKFNWVSDSCHSGDLTRELVNPWKSIRAKGHMRSPPLFIKQTPRAYPIPHELHGKIARCRTRNLTKALIGQILDVGFISGCKSNQTSADAFIDNRPCGALSYYLLKNLRIFKNQPIYKLVDAINVDLTRAGYDQRPQSEGTRRTTPFLA